MSLCKSTGHHLSNGTCKFQVRGSQVEKKEVEDLCLPIYDMHDKICMTKFVCVLLGCGCGSYDKCVESYCLFEIHLRYNKNHWVI
jgi:hypothetical protein